MRRVIVVALLLIAAVTGCQRPPPEYVSHYTPPSSTGALPGSLPPASLPPAAPVAIIGDSYTGGTAVGGQGPDGWPALLAARLRQQGIDIAASVGAEEGSGYVTPGNQGEVLADQIPKVVRNNDRLVIVFGSESDSGVPAEELQPAVRQALDAVRAAAPDARIVVIGPAWTDPNPPPDVIQKRDVIRTEAEQTGATFVDPIAEEWLQNLPDSIGSDGVHLSDAGHAFMADKIAPIVAQQLPPSG